MARSNFMRRATENLTVETGSNGTSQRFEGADLRAFLMSLDEFQQSDGRFVAEPLTKSGRHAVDAHLTLNPF